MSRGNSYKAAISTLLHTVHHTLVMYAVNQPEIVKAIDNALDRYTPVLPECLSIRKRTNYINFAYLNIQLGGEACLTINNHYDLLMLSGRDDLAEAMHKIEEDAILVFDLKEKLENLTVTYTLLFRDVNWVLDFFTRRGTIIKKELSYEKIMSKEESERLKSICNFLFFMTKKKPEILSDFSLRYVSL